MKETADISITIGLLEAEIDSLKDAYKNCKFSALKREYSTQLVSHKQALKMLKQAAALEPLINQEVEKRIAERMPSSPEIFQFVKSNLPWLIKSKRGNLQYPFVSVHANEEIEKHLSHALFEWLRSRLTEKPNNSQNTEGGEG